MNYKLLPLVLLFIFSLSANSKENFVKKSKNNDFEVKDLSSKIEMVYHSINANSFKLPELACFKKAMEGFYKLKEKGSIQKDILTIVDFSLSSTRKRMWVIDLSTNIILFHSFVTHGMNSGGEFAKSFSNSHSSNKSSLGFYTTGETYFGKHGLSLKLDGLERGINNNARSRSVVVHGANYANPSILKSQRFLGRSQGCPAIPLINAKKIINTIKGRSCLFIYHPNKAYEITSKLIG